MQNLKEIHLIFCVALILINSTSVYSQVASDLELIIRFNPPISVNDSHLETDDYIRIPAHPQEIVRLSIDFYQYFISTQDVPACLFTPSCSRFAEQSFIRFGMAKGILLTSDRLQRCHTFSDKDKLYDFNFDLKRYEDPVWHYGGSK